MEWTTAEGKSYEEAVAALLKSLGADKTEVEIEDLGEAKKFFGFGGAVVKVRGRLRTEAFAAAAAAPAKPAPAKRTAPRPAEKPAPSAAPAEPVDMTELGDMAEKVRAFLEVIVAGMGIKNAVIDVHPGSDEVRLNIISSDGGMLIGKNGETLEALQTLVEIYAGRLNGAKFPFVVDTEEYRIRRFEKLRGLAEKSADRAISSGRQVFLGAMKPAERKAIHTFLQDHPKVKTRSQGVGDNRQVVVFPVK